MQISGISSFNPNFKGVERMNDKNVSNFSINGAGSGIGKNMTRQYLLAHFAPEGVWNKWDELAKIYEKQNLVVINLGSMGMKNGQKLADLEDEVILDQIKHGNVLGDLPDAIKLSIKRTGEKTEEEDTRELFLEIESAKRFERVKLEATRDTIDWSKYKTQILVDTSGANTTMEKMKKFIGGTVKYAVLSAPSKDPEMLTVVPGINNHQINEINMRGNVISA